MQCVVQDGIQNYLLNDWRVVRISVYPWISWLLWKVCQCWIMCL